MSWNVRYWLLHWNHSLRFDFFLAIRSEIIPTVVGSLTHSWLFHRWARILIIFTYLTLRRCCFYLLLLACVSVDDHLGDKRDVEHCLTEASQYKLQRLFLHEEIYCFVGIWAQPNAYHSSADSIGTLVLENCQNLRHCTSDLDHCGNWCHSFTNPN